MWGALSEEKTGLSFVATIISNTCHPYLQFYSQSQSYVTTDGQSACLSWCQASIWGPRPHFYHCQTVACLLMCGAFSDKTGRLVSSLYSLGTVCIENTFSNSFLIFHAYPLPWIYVYRVVIFISHYVTIYTYINNIYIYMCVDGCQANFLTESCNLQRLIDIQLIKRWSTLMLWTCQ
jgi:hypothetical protein